MSSNQDNKFKKASSSDFKNYLIFISQYAKKHKRFLAFQVFFIFTFIIAGRLIPLTFGWAVDYGIKKQSIDTIYLCAYGLLACNLLRAALSFMISYGFRFVGQKILFEVRRDLMEHVQRIKISYFDKTPSGRIITRIANDTHSLSDLFSQGISGIFINFIEILSILIALFLISWQTAFVVILVLPPIIWGAYILSEKIRIQYIQIKSKLSSINAYSAETLNGIQVVQLYGGEDLAIKGFEKDVNDYENLQLTAIKYFALLWPLVEFFQLISVLISLVLGLYLLENNLITIGQIGAFILMLQGFFRPLRFILEKYNQVQNGVTSSQRIIRLFQVEEEPQNTSSSEIVKKNLDSKVALSTKNLSFSYDGETKVLKDINLEILKGKKTALIGRTGSGKTTLVSLFQGFYETKPESLFLYDKDINDYDIEDLRKPLLVIRQEEFIFKGTVSSNIRLGRSQAPEKDVLRALESVGLQLDPEAQTDEMGSNLSAGEKQLIALARVLLFDPEIVILDEATSHIDSVSEQKVLQAINKVLKGRTSIIIAHRLSTVMDSDHVIILKDGRIVEQGNPNQLVTKKDSVFNSFYDELL